VPARESAPDSGSAPAAAFFDLDRTLMEGSSAFQFGRAAYRAGLLGRRQLAADAWANMRFRLHGSTDEGTHALRDRISASLEGTRVLDLERLGAAVLAGVLPRVYPRMLEIAHAHQDAGRQVYIVTAASQELAQILAQVLTFDGAIGSQFSAAVDGVYTGQPTGLFVYRADKARAVEDLARELVRSLDEQQSSRAIVSAVPPIDMVGGNRSVLGDREDPLRLSQIFRAPISDALRAVLDEAQRSNEERIGLGQAHLEAVRYGSDAKGLRADELLASQQATLRTLLDAYVSRFPDDLAELESAKFTGGNLAALSFAWAGSTEPRRPHYYLIQGPRLVVEYDNVQRDTNHVHTIWRDPEGDFGRDALAEHHASAHH